MLTSSTTISLKHLVFLGLIITATCQMTMKEKLQNLRTEMKKEGVSAFVIPTSGQHPNGPVSNADKRREWLSDFTGSAGTAVVSLTNASVWVDSRYYIQAKKELDSNFWQMQKSDSSAGPSISEWLASELSVGDTVGIDPKITSISSYKTLGQSMSDSKMKLIPVDNLVDRIWTDRPAQPNSEVWYFSVNYTGEAWTEKMKKVVASMKKERAQRLVLSQVDDIAWLTNLRGWDTDYTPVFLSHAIISQSSMSLFVRNVTSRLTTEAKKHINVGKVCSPGAVGCFFTELFEYDKFEEELKKHLNPKSVWISPSDNAHIRLAVGPTNEIFKATPVGPLKVVKNSIELNHIRKSQIRDSATIVKFAAKLEEQILSGGKVTEYSAASDLDSMRSHNDNFQRISFKTISASGPNAALPHYSVQKNGSRQLSTNEIYLLDSGAQYLDGTTDITRTFHFGDPTDEEIDSYTRVLMGAIDLAASVFPEGPTRGENLAPLARSWLWKTGKDFGHGTGHGIGFFLDIHEEYTRLRFQWTMRRSDSIYLQPGVILSDEPGYYEEGKYGIRLETDIVTLPKMKSAGVQYLHWEALSYVPFEVKLTSIKMLTSYQLDYINKYHKKCKQLLTPLLKNDDRALRWLNERTRTYSIENTGIQFRLSALFYLPIAATFIFLCK